MSDYWKYNPFVLCFNVWSFTKERRELDIALLFAINLLLCLLLLYLPHMVHYIHWCLHFRFINVCTVCYVLFYIAFIEQTHVLMLSFVVCNISGVLGVWYCVVQKCSIISFSFFMAFGSWICGLCWYYEYSGFERGISQIFLWVEFEGEWIEIMYGYFAIC